MDTLQNIQNTMAAYCRYIDTKQWDALYTVLAKDASFEFQNSKGEVIAAFQNPSELITFCKNTIGKAVTVHHLHNMEVTPIWEQHAEVIWAMEDRWYMQEGSNSEFNYFHGYGHYKVRFTLQETQWLISIFVLSRLMITTT